MAVAESSLPGSPAARGFLLALALVAAGPARAADGLAIVGATLFDGTDAPAQKDAVIVVLEDKIQSVGPRSRVALPKGIPYLDGRGFFVVPGRLREPEVAASVREKVRAGAAFERALAEVLRAQPGLPEATIAPGRPADLALLGKDPREGLENLGSVKRAFKDGREVVP